MNSSCDVAEVGNPGTEVFAFPSLSNLKDETVTGADASMSAPVGSMSPALTPALGFDTAALVEASAVEPSESVEGSGKQGVPVNLESSEIRLAAIYAEELAALREAARREGFDTGYAYGKSVADAEVRAAVEQVEADGREARAQWERETSYALAALREAAGQFEQRSLPVLEDMSESIVATAFQIVEHLLGRELATATDPGRDAVERAMRLLDTDAPVVVRINPDDYNMVDEGFLAGLPANVTVRPDVNVERTGAVAESDASRVDAQLSAAVARVKAVLSQ